MNPKLIILLMAVSILVSSCVYHGNPQVSYEAPEVREEESEVTSFCNSNNIKIVEKNQSGNKLDILESKLVLNILESNKVLKDGIISVDIVSSLRNVCNSTIIPGRVILLEVGSDYLGNISYSNILTTVEMNNTINEYETNVSLDNVFSADIWNPIIPNEYLTVKTHFDIICNKDN